MKKIIKRCCINAAIICLLVMICGLVNVKVVHAEDVFMGNVIAQYGNYNKGNLEIESTGTNLKNISKTDDGDFKILFVTDMHLSARGEYYDRNIKAMNAVRDMVAMTNPDLIVVGGDLVFAMPYTDDPTDCETFKMCMAYMDQIGVPWIYTFGNHDWDFYGRRSQSDVYNLLSTSKSLIKFDLDSSIYGYSNGEYKLFNNDGSLSRIIYSLDSGGNILEQGTTETIDYDYIHQNQVDWYAERIADAKDTYGENVQSFMFMHIPLPEYQDAWDAYQSGSPNVEFMFGDKKEDVCCSETKSSLASVMTNLGSTQAVFCGHDHMNYYSIRYQELTYIYNHSIDYSAYPGIDKLTEQRGATLLTLSTNGQAYTFWGIKYADMSDRSMTVHSEGKEIPKEKFTGMKEINGEWLYFKDDVVDSGYTGMAENQYGWWYFENGRINWDYTGMAENQYGWWYFENGRINWNYTGMAENEYGWWYFENGRINWGYTGMAENKYGWWYFEGGRINWDYTGIAENRYGTWHFKNGRIDWDYKEIATSSSTKIKETTEATLTQIQTATGK